MLLMRRLWLAAAGFLMLAPSAWGAAAISGEAQRQLDSQTTAIYRPDKEPVTKIPEKPEIILEENKETPPPVEEGPTFFVKTIKLEGNTVLPSKMFEPLAAPFENRSSSFAKLREFSDIVTNAYRSEGYITSRAYIPPQTVTDGAVKIKILEGKIGRVYVRDNRYFSTQSYEKYMMFGPKRVFRYQDLERNIYKMTRNPSRKAKVYLIPGDTLGRSDIILKVTDSNPFHGYYEYNNRGTRFTHLSRHTLNIGNDNFLGYDDSVRLSGTFAEEGAFQGGGLSYNFPIPQVPVTLNLSAGIVKTRLVGSLEPLEIEGKSVSFSPGLTYYLVQRPERTVEWYAGFNYVNSISRVAGIESSRDRVRSIQTGPRLTLQDKSGRTIANVDAHFGLPGVFGGLDTNDANASVPNSAADFVFYTVNFARLQRLPRQMVLVMRAGGQWTRDTLVSVEQFRAGGAFTVRGYPESDSAGDYGWTMSAELNAPAHFLPKSWMIPLTKRSWYDSLRFVTFFDAAKTYFRERSSIAVEKDKLLLGTGFGTRLELNEHSYISADVGFPVGDDSTDKNNTQFHITMRGGF